MAGLHIFPTDASPTPSRTETHGSGLMWFATPSSQKTFTSYSLAGYPAQQQVAEKAELLMVHFRTIELFSLGFAQFFIDRGVSRPRFGIFGDSYPVVK